MAIKPPKTTPPASDQPADERAYMTQEEADRQARLEYLRSIAPAPKKKHLWVRIVLMVVLVAALAAGGYWLWHTESKHHTNDTKATATQKSTPATSSQAIATSPHTSTGLSLSFNYPQGWTVSDTGGATLTVTSPAMTLKSANNQNVTGQVIATIQSQQSTIPAFQKGDATAVMSSQKITYTQPTQDQRAQTYISFLSYAGSTSSGIDGVYITGDDGYQQGQNIPQSDVVQVNPLITVTFKKCANSGCTGTSTPLTLAASSWNSSATVTKDALAFLTSLAIQ